MLNYGLAFLCGLHSEIQPKFNLMPLVESCMHYHKTTQHNFNRGRKPPQIITEHRLPGKSNTAAGPVGISEDASRNDLAKGLQHALQLLLIHRHRQVGDVEVGGVLLLLLCRERKANRSRFI